jgi:hypothetical protein
VEVLGPLMGAGRLGVGAERRLTEGWALHLLCGGPLGYVKCGYG